MAKYQKQGPSALDKFKEQIKNDPLPRLTNMMGAYEDARNLSARRGNVTNMNKAQRMIEIIQQEIESRK